MELGGQRFSNLIDGDGAEVVSVPDDVALLSGTRVGIEGRREAQMQEEEKEEDGEGHEAPHRFPPVVVD